MRNLFTSTILLAVCSFLGCSSEQKPATPIETFKTYTKALKKKDTTTMKLLLTSETLKAHEQEAKAMGTTVDEIVNRESIVGENQTAVEFRNEKIDGERATLEVKNFEGKWETIFFLLEGGEWKIDKKGYADQLLREIEEENRRADELNSSDVVPPLDTNTSPPPESDSEQPPLSIAETPPPVSNTNQPFQRRRDMPRPVERPVSDQAVRP